MCRADRCVEFEVVDDIGRFGLGVGGVDCVEMSRTELVVLLREVRLGGVCGGGELELELLL